MIGYTVLNTVATIQKNEKLEYVSLLFMIPGVVVEALLILGIARIILKVARNEDYKFSEMFSCAKYWLKTLGIMLLTSLFTLLWSLLLIVPGIIKALSYSMALFILAENPEKGVLQCINESKEITKGYKKKLFGLNLSISVWLILYTVFMFGIILGLPFILTHMFKSVLTSIIIIFATAFLLSIIYAVILYITISFLYVAKGVFYLEITQGNMENDNEIAGGIKESETCTEENSLLEGNEEYKLEHSEDVNLEENLQQNLEDLDKDNIKIDDVTVE